MQEILNLKTPYQFIVIIILLIVAMFATYLIITLLLFPFMQIFNAITDKNKSNLIPRREIVMGVVTESISTSTIGEILITDKHGSKIYPAKLYMETTEKLEKETPIIVIDFDSNIALVVKNKALVNVNRK